MSLVSGAPSNPGPSAPFQRLRFGRMHWDVAPELEGELFGPEGLRLSQWQADGCAETIKEGPHRAVYRINVPGGPFILKHYRMPGIRARLQNLIRPCKARLEWNAQRRLQRAGIPTFDVAACGRRRIGAVVTDNYLISREITGVTPLDAFVTTLAELPQPRQLRIRRQLTLQLGEIIARLHCSRLLHPDLHAGNLLIRLGPGDDVRMWVIDLHALQRRPWLSEKQRWDNLTLPANLLRHFATPVDQWHFFRSYRDCWSGAAEAEGGSVPATGRQPSGEVKSEARRLAAHFQLSYRNALERAERKLKRSNKRQIVLRTGRAVCGVIAELGRPLLKRLAEDPEQLFAPPLLKSWLHRDEELWLAEIQLPVGDTHRPCRAESFPATASGVAAWLPGTSRARRMGSRQQWELAMRLSYRGIPVASPVLFLAQKSGRSCRDVILWDAPDGWQALPESLAERGMTTRRVADQRTVQQIAAGLGDCLGRLHRHGFDAPGIARHGFLVSEERPAEVRIVDVAAVREDPRLTATDTVSTMVRLAQDAADRGLLGRSAAGRFLRAYVSARSGDDWRTLWRRIQREMPAGGQSGEGGRGVSGGACIRNVLRGRRAG